MAPPSTRSPELLHGTLELLILRLVADGPLNGYALGRRIEELTDDALQVDEGSLYPALYRMERRGFLRSSWARTENNRRAKFYRITTAGRSRLRSQRAEWSGFQTAVQKILESA
jgi:transcriptional regulator